MREIMLEQAGLPPDKKKKAKKTIGESVKSYGYGGYIEGE